MENNKNNVSHYPVYKGLKKPFVFKGYKGKFIYYAAGGLILSLVIGAIGTSFNIILGLGMMILGVAATIYFVGHFQKTRGLFNKSKDSKTLWVHQNRIKKIINK
ncbi:DUF4133 domain-containing protein [Chryseobacterium antibioticum]|uniref:DUF4133 domain-containing protein n=1 Tax=Chryseobacterium pyrolae TaxID=2987481 RepID=A0ABT2IP69_9FLAO|nr:DUF4133 domain-containing protein [Chryseobacterium pyrolae]MCT2409987.1 DUF4133 domain-containing protein [Chryseobacterium pyrolae]